MGDPIKVKVGEKEVAFLCCKGCVGKDINAEHWKTIQTNLAAAQKTCPVMGKAVDASMKSTVINGRKIFVCCPPCIKKIEADPATYIAKPRSTAASISTATVTTTPITSKASSRLVRREGFATSRFFTSASSLASNAAGWRKYFSSKIKIAGVDTVFRYGVDNARQREVGK